MRIAVLGAGNGGLAFAAQLKLNGHVVHLYDKYNEAIIPIYQNGGIVLKQQDSDDRFVTIDKISSNMAETVELCSLILIVTPAFAHHEIASTIAPHIKDEQIIILHPGRTGGALEFRYVLQSQGIKATVAETQTLLYASRRTGEAEVTIYGTKQKVALAALPSSETPLVVSLMNQAIPNFIQAPNVLYTSLHNIGAIFHPAPTILNTARIETTGESFEYYHQGITPSIARLLEKMDDERVQVARKLGLELPSAKEWIYESYGTQGNSLYEGIQNNQTYSGIMAPTSIQVRYISEDVPMSLVPISSFGQLVRVPTPAIDSIIELASILHQTDYRLNGRNLSRLGLTESLDCLDFILE